MRDGRPVSPRKSTTTRMKATETAILADASCTGISKKMQCPNPETKHNHRAKALKAPGGRAGVHGGRSWEGIHMPDAGQRPQDSGHTLGQEGLNLRALSCDKTTTNTPFPDLLGAQRTSTYLHKTHNRQIRMDISRIIKLQLKRT